MSNNENRLKNFINFENITYFFFGLYMIIAVLNITAICWASKTAGLILKLLRYLCYAVFTVKIIYDWTKGSSITWTILTVGIASILICAFSKNTSILILLLILTALRNLDINKLIKIAFKIFIVLFFVIVNLALLNVIPDWLYPRGDAVRHSLGFFYPTDAFGIYLAIILMYFYIRKSETTYLELLILETINIFLYKYTDGRLSFILINAILIVMGLSKLNFVKNILHNKYIKKILQLVSYVLPATLCISVIIITQLYGINCNIAISLNELLSDRINLTHNAFETYPITLFGEEIEWYRMGRIWT